MKDLSVLNRMAVFRCRNCGMIFEQSANTYKPRGINDINDHVNLVQSCHRAANKEWHACDDGYFGAIEFVGIKENK